MISKNIRRPAILLALLVAALVCYGVGMTVGAGILIGLGIMFELSFWVRLLRKKR